jgi:hypothetical protein
MRKALLADAILQLIADTTRSDALAPRAMEEKAHATGESAYVIAKAGKYSVPVQS